MSKSRNVKELVLAVDQITGKAPPAGDGPDAQRYWLAKQLTSMYMDLDKDVRRSGEAQYGASWFGRIGLAATAASSAVAGTVLATGPKASEWPMIVGYVTASLGVVGAIAAALKLTDLESNNRAAHAGYLAVLRSLGAYLVSDFSNKNPADIERQVATFAAQIASVESRQPAPGGAAP